MDVNWRRKICFKLRLATTFVLVCFFQHNLALCWSLNSEGLALLKFKERVTEDPFGALGSWKHDEDGDLSPCYWSGVECSNGKVVMLNLRDLLLGGTLAPELSKLSYIQVIILRNNSFTGLVPKDIGALKALEVLDLGHNNFSGPFPIDLGNSFSLSTILLDHNNYIDSTTPEIHDLDSHEVEEFLLRRAAKEANCKEKACFWKERKSGDQGLRRLLQVTGSLVSIKDEKSRHSKRNSRLPPTHLLSVSPSPSPSFSLGATPFSAISVTPSIPMSSSKSESPSPPEFSIPSPYPMFPKIPSPQPSVNPDVVSRPQHTSSVPFSSPAPTPNIVQENTKIYTHYMVYALGGTAGAFVLLLIAYLIYFFCRSNKVVTVKPWATGLSGQLQKAFVTGVPKLRRSELEIACEDFSNIIGSLPNGTIYKGTLSSGVEIAVAASDTKSAGYWSENVEARFRNKIDTLSKINHKNFVNLIGYCKEEYPFTRMMVFEYAPNGTLFEHLHIKESEHLEWPMRLRIAMGIAYCLEYMYQLNPPIVHSNLQSSSIYLTEDYAAKLSDFNFWNEVVAAKKGAITSETSESTPSACQDDNNIFRFGLILFEMITGKLPHLDGNGSLPNWVSDYLKEEKSQREMVDPTLKIYGEREAEKLLALVKDCILPNPKQRPTVEEVVARLKEITSMGPDGAMPKTSPLWWAELEILSSDSS